ncbi:MAG: hypothetical protein Q4B23_03695 [Helcococcus sp.]|nr:hypothetical protein [Helcococcus sp.]
MKQIDNDLRNILDECLKKRQENEIFDLKLEWHKTTEDLIKDIVCFANTTHNQYSYIFFGIVVL